MNKWAHYVDVSVLLISSVSRWGWRCCVQNWLSPVLQLKLNLSSSWYQIARWSPVLALCYSRLTLRCSSPAGYCSMQANTSWFCVKLASPLPTWGCLRLARVLCCWWGNYTTKLVYLKIPSCQRSGVQRKPDFFPRANNKASRIVVSFGNLGVVT